MTPEAKAFLDSLSSLPMHEAKAVLGAFLRSVPRDLKSHAEYWAEVGDPVVPTPKPVEAEPERPSLKLWSMRRRKKPKAKPFNTADWEESR